MTPAPQCVVCKDTSNLDHIDSGKNDGRLERVCMNCQRRAMHVYRESLVTTKTCLKAEQQTKEFYRDFHQYLILIRRYAGAEGITMSEALETVRRLEDDYCLLQFSKATRCVYLSEFDEAMKFVYGKLGLDTYRQRKYSHSGANERTAHNHWYRVMDRSLVPGSGFDTAPISLNTSEPEKVSKVTA